MNSSFWRLTDTIAASAPPLETLEVDNLLESSSHLPSLSLEEFAYLISYYEKTEQKLLESLKGYYQTHIDKLAQSAPIPTFEEFDLWIPYYSDLKDRQNLQLMFESKEKTEEYLTRLIEGYNIAKKNSSEFAG